MKTVNCILSGGPERSRSLPKVVDLAAWRAEHRAELEEPETERVSAPERRRSREPVRRRWTALDWAELAATLAVAAAFLALAARVLLF